MAIATAATKRGFSLVEMLIYVTVLVFMLVIVLQVVVSVVKADRVIKAARSIDNSAILSLERIGREVRLADSAAVATSTLSLSGTDDEGNARTVEFYLSSGRIMMREDGIEAGALTEERVEVADLVFSMFATSTFSGIRTEVRFETGTSTHYRAETFYSSTLLR